MTISNTDDQLLLRNLPRYKVHRFTESTLPKDTWRIRNVDDRLRWIEMHLKRNPEFECRLKNYSAALYSKVEKAIRRNKENRYNYFY